MTAENGMYVPGVVREALLREPSRRLVENLKTEGDYRDRKASPVSQDPTNHCPHEALCSDYAMEIEEQQNA